MRQSHQYGGRLQTNSYPRIHSRLAPLNVLDRETPTGHWTTAHVFSTASRTFALSRLEMSKASLSASDWNFSGTRGCGDSTKTLYPAVTSCLMPSVTVGSKSGDMITI